MSFFNNPKVSSAVVERVPCAFAKPNPDGSVGTHYTVVLFDNKQNIMYVGSECEHKHGESVAALHEMGGTTCFEITAKFRTELGKVKANKGVRVSHDPYRGDSKLSGVGPLMEAAFSTAKSRMVKVHNNRVSTSEPRFKVFTQKGPMLQRIVNKLTGNMLSLQGKVNLGNKAERTNTHVIQEQQYPSVFRVSETEVNEFSSTLCAGTVDQPVAGHVPPGLYLTLSPSNNNECIFAVRDAKGQWLIDEDRVKRYANTGNNPIEDSSSKWGISTKQCVFCNAHFERMSKHTQGAKHKDRVLEVVKLVCKATTPTGLRMVNNPRHKSAFFR